MFDGSSVELDAVTLLVALATCVISFSLAQLAILGIASYLKRKARKESAKSEGDLE